MGHLRDRFIAGLQARYPALSCNGPPARARHPGNANIRFPGIAAADLLATLQPRLAAATGAACTTGMPEPSHVLKAMGLDGEAAESSVRFSLGLDTTAADVAEAVALIGAAVESLGAGTDART